jgi:preprotein translocase subunit YajC
MLLPLLLIPVLYLVMIRPQQKRQKQWQEMLAGIKAGDRVTTAGGIRGIILSIKDDVIVIRVAPDNVKLEVAKSAIASVTQEGTTGARSFSESHPCGKDKNVARMGHPQFRTQHFY